jgi:hypothetical protein
MNLVPLTWRRTTVFLLEDYRRGYLVITQVGTAFGEADTKEKLSFIIKADAIIYAQISIAFPQI